MSASSSVSPSSSSPSASVSWRYIDDDGQVQGPFSLAQMTAWFSHGYFVASTRCQRDGDPADRFEPMASVFPPAIKQSSHTTHGSSHESKDDSEEDSGEAGGGGGGGGELHETEQLKEEQGRPMAEQKLRVEGGEEARPPIAVNEEPVDKEQKRGKGAPEMAAADAAGGARGAAAAPSAASSRSPPSPLTVANSTSPSSSASSPSSSASPADVALWYYVDDSCNLQGPFPTPMMTSWYLAGYFKPHTAVRRADEAQLVPLHARVHTAFIPAQPAHAAQDQQPTPTIVVPPTTMGNEGRPPASVSGDEAGAAAPVKEEPIKEEPRGGEQSMADAVQAAPASAASSTSPSSTAPSTPSSSSPPAHQWYYVDDSGNLQGPFPTSMMTAWHLAGYFKPHTAVRRADEPHLVELGSRAHTGFIPSAMHMPSPPPPPAAHVPVSLPLPMPPPPSVFALSPSFPPPLPPPPPPPPVLYTPEGGELDWFYVDNRGFERGPFSTSQMRHWHQQGFFTYNRCPVRAAHQPPGTALPIHFFPTPPPFTLSEKAAIAVEAAMRAELTAATAPPSPQPSAPPTRAGAPPQPGLEERWLYIDGSGQRQGPFTTEQMAGWYGEGYITRAIQVKQVGEEDGQGWRTVGERGEDCSFVRLHLHQLQAAAAIAAQQQYGQSVVLGRGKAVSAEHAQVSLRRDVGEHFYDHNAWQEQQQKRQRVG